jgi:dTDP-D-glucose 4,6-dehydratase
MFENLLSELTISNGIKELYSEILKKSIKKYSFEERMMQTVEWYKNNTHWF